MSQSLRLRISSRIEWIDSVEALASDLGRLIGFDQSIIYDVALAVHEALSNAIVHGNESVPSKPVNVEFQVGKEQGLQVKVRDQGSGFRVEDIPDPTAPANLLRPNGRGVFYIRKLMDEVDFSHTDSHGGELVMVKRQSAGDGAIDGPPGGEMKTQINQVGTVTIIRVKGKITIGEGDVQLRETIEGCLNEDKTHIIVDLGNVGFVDSSGIGELVGCLTTVKNRGGDMKLLNLTKKIHDLLQITSLVTVFEVYKDETEALASFN